ncbi:unnamed protein product [Zymoseptoria tritici ST99CH_1A5]|uniref:Uncharacterized protein n=1 Tax=Zymoseptoria tritici ST99CH_1A5 TaxID=1276529 RepID=A0A1Y6M0H3_ZYMTR|nr:unnamed protein product [Zymoseptoria tritici ST99CH_1A5]
MPPTKASTAASKKAGAASSHNPSHLGMFPQAFKSPRTWHLFDTIQERLPLPGEPPDVPKLQPLSIPIKTMVDQVETKDNGS